MAGYFSRIFEEAMTSAAGEFDPARLVGYGLTLLGFMISVVLAVYDTFSTGHFNYEGYATAMAANVATLLGSAAGVRVKMQAENAPDIAQQVKLQVSQLLSQLQQQSAQNLAVASAPATAPASDAATANTDAGTPPQQS